MGTTAKLQFYDWEPNRIVEDNGRVTELFTASIENPDPNTRNRLNRPLPLLTAVELAAKAKPKAEPEDVPPGERHLRCGGRQEERHLAVGPLLPVRAEHGASARLLAGPEANCKDLLPITSRRPARWSSRGSRRRAPSARRSSRSSATAGPPEGSQVIKVPRGIVVIQAERPKNLDKNANFNQWFVLEDDSELSGGDIKNPEQNFDQQTNEPIVTFEFTDKGRKAFARVTKRDRAAGFQNQAFLGRGENAFQTFAITLDNKLVSLATIDFRREPRGHRRPHGCTDQRYRHAPGHPGPGQEPPHRRAAGGPQADVEDAGLRDARRSGAAPGPYAAAVGLALTIFFLLAFYRVLGVVAAFTLIIYAVLLFALVKLIPITLTLPGIAGLILTLGVAADANIVIYERIKEEARAGRSIPAAISAGYSKALRTIIDANVVTIGVAFILFMLATAGVKGFAFTLGIGTLISLFTAVLATSAILGVDGALAHAELALALGAAEQKRPMRFDFMGKSRWFFSMSGVILLIGAFAIAGKGINFGIDFESGTRIKTPLSRAPAWTTCAARSARWACPTPRSRRSTTRSSARTSSRSRLPTLEPDQRGAGARQARRGLRRTARGLLELVDRADLRPQIARTALIAIVASLFLISLYIGLRFEFKFAVPVLIALFHDILITSGVYALAGREVTTATVAALLTILGYSLYDTIIVFDRIRENVPRMPRATFSQIVNRSMSEVLMRSLVTSFSALLPDPALMLFGGETLQDFAFALLVGMASGAYSSIFIAAPVLTEWKEREPSTSAAAAW